jgi:hypothetical protein
MKTRRAGRKDVRLGGDERGVRRRRRREAAKSLSISTDLLECKGEVDGC